MIINKIFNKNNSKLIAEKYVGWLKSGVSASDILVLTLSSDSRKNIIKNILKISPKTLISDMKITTFSGLTYNSISDNWSVLENQLHFGEPKILPHLSGLEISQFLLKQIIKEEQVKGYNSKKSLLHQIFKRYSLIVNNHLTDEEVLERSKILKESFYEDANRIIKKLKSKTAFFRVFDNIRQSQVFDYIYTNTNYFNNIKYLILEDGDECSPLIIDFVRYLASQLKDSLIILDKDGGSRSGYLCADMFAHEEFKQIFNEDIIEEDVESDRIKKLKDNILNDEHNKISGLTMYSLSKYVDMLEYAIENINNLISQGLSPKEISIITPIQDKMTKFLLDTKLKNCTPIYISGSEKLAENPLVKSVLTVLKLTLNMPVEEYEKRIVLTKYLNIPTKYLNQDSEILKSKFDKYAMLCKLIDSLKKSSLTLSEKAYKIYTVMAEKVSEFDLSKFNFFLKELQSFEQVFKNYYTSNLESEIIVQIENSIVSDNPYSTIELNPNEIVVSTPQKIIDNKIQTKYQFWLDISSQEWIKQDIGPLYNSWVFRKGWNKKDYTIDDNIILSKLKTYKVLRKLILNTDKVIALSSLFDSHGLENFGGIEQYLVPEISPNITYDEKKQFKITPRADQQPVLEYESGTMSISAVPGAGKTTILLALIIELMKRDIDPENIYVLTYMDSAAKNFKDRIKSINKNNIKLPNISTIHGLALRIIKENSNYERLGLNPDFEICDDIQRNTILKSISQELTKHELDEFDKAISTMKLSQTDIKTNPEINRLLNIKKGTSHEQKLNRFLKFFMNYQNKLSEENIIDYDDILISAVKLLKENSDILTHYQDQCQYIIEDEAQDSSAIQQELINLLSGKWKNLIRCGDINQAITTTFTNADIEGFKNFIDSADKRVNMDHSQRCAKGIYELANSLVRYGNNKCNNPFYEIYMKPVKDRNPKSNEPIIRYIYETEQEEKLSIVKKIKSIFSKNPDATIGILLRNNYQVNNWSDYITNSGLSVITRNECLAQKKIFKVIFSILKLISDPYDNSNVAQTYKSLSECGFFKPHLESAIENFGKTDTSNIIRSKNKTFISTDNDDIMEPNLARFHWDMNYWLSYPESSIDEIALRIGMYYFSEEIEKANIHLISTLCSKLDTEGYNKTVSKLEELAQKPNLSGFKFFTEEVEQELAYGKIQIMTYHKSKGDEFDYVFLPELSEKNLSLDMEQFSPKKNSNFIENVRALNKDYTPKTEKEQKIHLINENYRLLYVAITRAKKQLSISVSKTEKYFNKQKEVIPNMIFEIIDISNEAELITV